MRSARNSELLVDRVREASGIEIDVISGTQEAYLLKLGIETRIALHSGRSMLVDVGGGSVEVVVVDHGNVVSANSYKLGALRMLNAYRDAEGEVFAGLVEKHLKGIEHRILKHLDVGKIDRYAAVGGNIDCLADLVAERHGKREQDGIDTCKLKDIDREVANLAGMGEAERIKKHGLRPDRADTIVPAGIVYVHLGKLAKVDQVLVPRTGVKEGLLIETVTGNRESFAAQDHVDVVLASCRAMGRRFHQESGHAESVLVLARQLFDQTKELHGLGERARVLLEAAALLHDVGVAVNNDGHHKHSQYLIESTELVGLGSYERHLVAMLARYHRKAMPSREHSDYMALRRRERAMVERLAALLRLADALDRQHASVVVGVEARLRGKTLALHAILAPDSDTGLTLEAKAVAAKGALFEQLFGYRPKVMQPGPEA